jgi:arylsulfatase A-like enzyme
MSSLPVATHGAASNRVPTRPVRPLLPLVLRDAGYQTAAFVSARHLGRGGPLGSVLGDAFDVYRSAADWWVPLRGEQTTERVRQWLRQACGRPFFAWVHYWDPHMPHAPPAPFDAGYDGDPTAPSHAGLDGIQLGWSLLDLDQMGAVLARHATTVGALARLLGVPAPDVEGRVLDPGAVPPNAPAEAMAKLDELRDAVRRELPLHPGLAQWLAGVRDPDYPAALYAGELSYADHEVGELIDALDALGLGTQTVVVVVADHGESLGEHGIWFDHPGLYETTVRVPLVF